MVLANLVLTVMGAPSTAQASPRDFTSPDHSKVVILAYHRIDDPSQPQSNLSFEKFAAQIEVLKNDNYNVMALDDVLDAWESGDDIPRNSVAITFDGAYRSIYDQAIPLLIKHEYPFTIFIPSDQTNIAKHLDWKTLKTIGKYDGASFGVLPASYRHITSLPRAEQSRLINISRRAFKDNMGYEAHLFAYPFGEITPTLRDIIDTQGFRAAFGLQSGAAYHGYDRAILPRFAMTDAYSDIDRFRMIIGSYAMPITALSPASFMINDDKAVTQISFDLDIQPLTLSDVKNLSCFISEQDKPAIHARDRHITITPAHPITDDRTRLNCTMPFYGQDEGMDHDLQAWRWFGMMFHAPHAR